MLPRTIACTLLVALSIAAGGCDGGSGTDGGVRPDGSTPGIDGGPLADSGPRPDGSRPVDGGGGCVPSVEICGDRIDQNCDGRDQGCGDNDGDSWQACRAGDDLTRCDCDDSRADVFPSAGVGVPGAPEICDGRDNDCNGRVDESAACCAACVALGDPARGDICTPAGACECSSAAGEGPCPSGQTCCAGGCTDIMSDRANCGYCGVVCTREANTCAAGNCRCGTAAPCADNCTCSASGVCGAPCGSAS